MMKLIRKFLDIFPTDIILSFFGIGRMESGGVKEVFLIFVTLVLSSVSVLVVPYLPHYPQKWLPIWSEDKLATVAVPILSLALILSAITVVCVFISALRKSLNDEEVEIHNIISLMVTVAISMPIIFMVYSYIDVFTMSVCTQYLQCLPIVQIMTTAFIVVPLIYFPFYFINSKKLWPIGVLDARLPKVISVISASYTDALYTSIIFYIVAFFLLDLKTVSAGLFIQGLYLGTESFLTRYIWLFL